MRKRAKNSLRIGGFAALFFLVFFLLMAIPAVAIGLGDYRKALSSTQSDLDQMLDEVAKSEVGEGTDGRFNQLSAGVRGRFPFGQTVDVPGGTIEADTDWLSQSLNELDAESNLSEKAVIITSIKERVAGINQRIDQLEKTIAAERSKDEDKQKLAEILRREEYQKPKAEEESLMQRWRREFLEWLQGMFPQTAPQVGNASGFQSLSVVLQILLYALLAAAIGFLFYRFAPFLRGRFGKGTKKKKGDRVILGERIADEASANDLFAEADELARKGELRLAIRKGYVALLCELSDRKLIGLARHKTNRDYLRDVRKRPRLFENMSGVTLSFEKHWYGFKAFENDDWEAFKASYERTVNESQQQ